MLPVGWGVHIGRHIRGCQSLDLLLHTRLHTFKHSAASSKNDVLEEIAPDVSMALYDGIVGVLMNSVMIVLHLLSPVRG